MLKDEEHLENLIRHIDLVRQAGSLLGKRLMAQGRNSFARILIGNCYQHDVTKFAGIEWKYLHAGKDVPKEELGRAIQQHVETNWHHPEAWESIDEMPEIYIAEMVCDWYARSQEFGTGLREWVKGVALEKYKIEVNSRKYNQIMFFIDLLLEDTFVR